MGLGPPGTTRHAADALRPSFIAERLGLTVQTVKDRIARLEEAGVIEGTRLLPHPGLLGLHPHLSLWRLDEARKARALTDLHAVEEVIGLLDFFGPDFYVFMAFRSPTERESRKRLVAALTGASHVLDLPRPLPPAPARAPTPLDWRVMAAFAEDARRPVAEVAAELGVTPRTVRNRLDRLARDGAVAWLPIVDRTRLEGLVLAHLLVRLGAAGDAGATARAVASALGDRLLYAATPGEEGRHFDAGVYGRSAADVERLRATAAAVPGVAEARTLVPCGAFDNPGLFIGSFRERVAAALR